MRQDVDNLKKKTPAPAVSEEETITKKEETPNRGRITKIDPTDATLVEVDLGKDAGLEKHNTLEIFRPGPQRDYVGTLRIFDVYKESAFCRLVSTNPVREIRCQGWRPGSGPREGGGALVLRLPFQHVHPLGADIFGHGVIVLVLDVADNLFENIFQR